MTQKSFARKQRDMQKKELENNNCWTELNQVYESIKLMLYQHTIISTLASNKELLKFLKNPSDTATSIKVLSNDLINLNARLNDIKAKHTGKIGGSQDPDEVISSIMLAQEYAQMMEEHTSVIQPNALKIHEDFAIAEAGLAEFLKNVGAKHDEKNNIVDVEIVSK